MNHCYRAFGLRIGCEWELPELVQASPSAPVDVAIRAGSHPLKPSPDESRLWVRVCKTSVFLTWPAVGTFEIRNASEVFVSPYDGVSKSTVRLPLLGAVLGILLHLRGVFTLHASGVSIGGNAVAIVGPKGAGKSTLAASLQQRGHLLLTDDVLAIHDDMTVAPAFPQVKLHSDSAAAIGLSSSALHVLHRTVPKRALRVPSHFDDRPRRLAAVFVLSDGDDPSTNRMSGRRAFFGLFREMYALRFLGTEGVTPEDFRRCEAIARTVPVIRLVRPRDLNRLHETAARVEETVRSLAESSPETTSR